MRVLLDENLPYQLRPLFADSIEVITVGYRGWKGKGNGELLQMAAAEFDAFVTTDRGILYEQNLEEIELGFVLLEADRNHYEALAPLIPQVNTVLQTLQKGQVVRVSALAGLAEKGIIEDNHVL